MTTDMIGLANGQVLYNVHTSDQCAGRACCIHNPSDHHMVDWPMVWRSDRGLMERTCPARRWPPRPRPHDVRPDAAWSGRRVRVRCARLRRMLREGLGMSSTYRILCLSHDPALAIPGCEFHSSRDGLANAEHAASHPGEYDSLANHTGCDLLIGRYSYPLVEVGCPAAPKDQKANHYPWHPHACEWVDVKWLRLLWHAMQQDPGTPLGKTVTDMPGCWSRTRLSRLSRELGCV